MVTMKTLEETFTDMINLDNRIDIVATIFVDGANPNGDPMMGNTPRRMFDDCGLISDVAIKRKIRDRAHALYGSNSGYDLFVMPTSDDDRTLNEKVGEFTNDGIIDVGGLLDRYFDLRAFGGVLITGKKDDEPVSEDDTKTETKKNKAKKNTKVKKNTDSITGCVTMLPAKTLKPIEITEIQIARTCVQSEEEKAKKHKSTFGTKYFVSNACYKLTISINSRLAAKTKFSKVDFLTLIESVATIFCGDESAARPSGSMDIDNMFVVVHSAIDGNESTRKTYNRLSPNGDEWIMDSSNLPDGMQIHRII